MDHLLAFPAVLIIAAVLVIAALVHGAAGFGFPVPSTPAIAIDVLIGTHILLAVDPEPLKLFLALMIVLYLQQNRIRQFDWTAIKRYPQ